MVERIRTLIWYGCILAILFGAYYVWRSYALAVVDEGFTYMAPTLEERNVIWLDRRPGTIASIKPNDVVAFTVVDKGLVKRMFGRVLATSGMTLTVRDNKLVIEGGETAEIPKGVTTLATGLLMPRETALIAFDSPKAPPVPLSKRVVSYQSIIGRVMGK